jgi:hypothetical protein
MVRLRAPPNKFEGATRSAVNNVKLDNLLRGEEYEKVIVNLNDDICRM